MPAPRLSVCITTRDRGDFLPLVVDSAARVADEIVVVDSGSTDGSLEPLRDDPRVTLRQTTFGDHFGRFKNEAIEAASGEWVLLLDSDELLGEDLVRDLPRLLSSARNHWYKLPRYWLVETDPLWFVESPKHYPDYQLRLFRNTPFWRYGDDQVVHESFPRQGRGRGRKLTRGHLLHYNFLMLDREARARHADGYRRLDPDTSSTSDMYLFEEFGGAVHPCRTGLAWPRPHDVRAALAGLRSRGAPSPADDPVPEASP